MDEQLAPDLRVGVLVDAQRGDELVDALVVGAVQFQLVAPRLQGARRGRAPGTATSACTLPSTLALSFPTGRRRADPGCRRSTRRRVRASARLLGADRFRVDHSGAVAQMASCGPPNGGLVVRDALRRLDVDAGRVVDLDDAVDVDQRVGIFGARRVLRGFFLGLVLGDQVDREDRHECEKAAPAPIVSQGMFRGADAPPLTFAPPLFFLAALMAFADFAPESYRDRDFPNRLASIVIFRCVGYGRSTPGNRKLRAGTQGDTTVLSHPERNLGEWPPPRSTAVAGSATGLAARRITARDALAIG